MKHVLLATVLALAAVPASAATRETGRAATAQLRPDLRTQQLTFDVERALLRLPYYDIFDSLAYQVREGGEVVLTGHVRTAWLKKDAERAVKRLPGVDTVVNEIEILPASFNDDRLRRAIYQSLFYDSPLDRYAFGASPSMRIIVKHGHVTLEGVVAGRMDKVLAEMKARQVFGVFGVTNNLSID